MNGGRARALAVGLVVASGAVLTRFIVACGIDSDGTLTAAAAEASVADATTDDVSQDVAPTSDGACSVPDAATLDAQEVAIGLGMVKQLGCQQCHGQILAGNNNGVASPGYGLAYPPNLTPDPATGIGCWSDEQVMRAILVGIDDQGRALCPPMPHFGLDGGVDEAGAHAIVQFLRTLSAASNKVPDTQCDGHPDAGPEGGDAGDAADADAADATDDAADDAADADAGP